MGRRHLPYAIMVALLASSASCGEHLPRPDYVAQPTRALVKTPFPPPPARTEFVPRQPAKEAVWIDGEWTWRGRKWGWIPGRWVIPPPGARFSPWTTVRASDGTLFFAQGTWRDAEGQAVSPPAPLALGTTGPSAAAQEARPAAVEPDASSPPLPSDEHDGLPSERPDAHAAGDAGA